MGRIIVASWPSSNPFVSLLKLLAFGSAIALSSGAHAQQTPATAKKGGIAAPQAVGKANQIRNTVLASVDERKLAVSDPVYGAEVIKAAERSHGELILNDNSNIVVGENSEISLDDFVVSAGGFESATLNVVKGGFRFISGDSAKGTFTIKTPLSTIGVRGTTFDVYVGEGGVTNVVLLQGAVTVCTTNSKCILADRSCDIIEVRSPDEIAEQPFLKGPGRSGQAERQLFGLLFDQNRFDRRFRAPTAVCNSRAAQELQNNGSESHGDDSGGGGRGQQSPDKTN